jgi:S-adenosylmethionine hydrolase
MASGPIVTLITDFGLRDPFVGIMKGVILGICPEARLVDLTHEVAPHDVLEAALALESAWRFFPPGTIHLAVVDPGVGSERRALAVEAAGHLFVGPDNGLFTFALQAPGWSAVSVETPTYRLPVVSHTFHGRDVFAPAAGHLACGVRLSDLGPVLGDPVRVALPLARREGDEIVGEIIGSDRFGNLVTSITAEGIDELVCGGGVFTVEVAGRELGSLAASYSAGLAGVPAAIMGSGGRLEVFVRNASARTALGVGVGAPVRVRKA